jgi:hypothetical protein
MLERYLIPIAPYALLAMACLAGLLILFAVTSDIRKLKMRQSKNPAPTAPPEDLQLKLEELQARLIDAEERANLVMAPAGFRSSLNMSKRSQVLRLSRRGEESQSIAETLSMPRKEVELLLKIHGLLLNNSLDNTS